MRTSPSNHRLVLFGLAGLAAVALVGCTGGGGGGGGGASTLNLVEFVGDGTDGFIFRNQSLEFLFSADIDPTTVSVTGFQVREGVEIVPGRVEVTGDTIIWSPVVLPGDRNDYDPPNYPPINGLGFEGGTKHTVMILGDSPFSIKTPNGRPLARTFQSSFVTSTDFMPEEDQVAPRVLTDVSPVFSPAPLVDGDPFSENPDDWPVCDPSALTIQVDFSERIHPVTLDPFATFTVTNVTPLEDPPHGVGSPALVRLNLDPQANRVVAQPLVTLGDDPDSTDPYRFEVRLTRGITDLAGTPLARDVVFHFKTADKPGELNYMVITETFDNDTYRDNSTNAKWGNGLLEGADTRQRETTYEPQPESIFLLAHPLIEVNNQFTPYGCRFQMRFLRNGIDAQPGESITGMKWAPLSNYIFYGTYRSVEIKIGHHSGDSYGLRQVFDVNWDVAPGTPLTVFKGDYFLPADGDIDWVDWPEFRTDYEYDNGKDLVFEYDMPEGGDTYQLFRNWSTATTTSNRIYGNGGWPHSISGKENTQYYQKFQLVTKKSYGQSLGYGPDPGFNAPVYGASLIVEDQSRAGTEINPLWAAASRGSSIPSGAELVEDIRRLNGSEAAAFFVELVANPFTGIAPRIFSISFAIADANPE